ncbi:MAG: polyprenyl synthetase family protein [Pyrinomonadaceae bacterium]
MKAVEKVSDVSIWRFVEYHLPAIERALEENLPLAPPEIETQFNEAVRYLIFPGGKRLRPVLTILGAELFGGKGADVMPAAAAVEYIHTSSIIFDDLPCMDNSSHRRGQLSLHEKYGEGLSTLVAIGFLNHSYRLVTIGGQGDAKRSLDAVLEIVDCVGPAGMVGGQSVDLMVFSKAECRTCSIRSSRDLQNLKTSALIRLSLRLGAILTGASDEALAQLSCFADCLGHAYQISDDIIDVEQDSLANGFEIRKNAVHSLSSLRSGLTVSANRARAILLNNFAPCEARDCLMQLVDYVATRKD